jgi:hypothetical protein
LPGKSAKRVFAQKPDNPSKAQEFFWMDTRVKRAHDDGERSEQ